LATLAHDREAWAELIDLDALARWMDGKALGTGPIENAETLGGGTQNILLLLERSGRRYVLRRPPLHLPHLHPPPRPRPPRRVRQPPPVRPHRVRQHPVPRQRARRPPRPPSLLRDRRRSLAPRARNRQPDLN